MNIGRILANWLTGLVGSEVLWSFNSLWRVLLRGWGWVVVVQIRLGLFVDQMNLNKSVERQKGLLARVAKGLCKKCVVTLRVMSIFCGGKARQGVTSTLVIQLMNLG